MAHTLVNKLTDVDWGRLLKRLGAPVPVGPELRRAAGPWRPEELRGLTCQVVAEGARGEELRAALARQGATLVESGAVDALVVAPGEDVAQWHGRVQPGVINLRDNGRVVLVMDEPAAQAGLAPRVARAAVVGFARSLGKELGRRGITVNTVAVRAGADAWLAPAVAFLVSPRACFISGEELSVGPTPAPAELGLRGQTAVVTGAAQGIGLAIAQRLVEEGARVVGVDRPGGVLAVEMLRLGAEALELDVTAPDAAAVLRQRTGGVDVLVHNAGITRDRTFRKLDAKGWGSVMDVNLGAPWRMTEQLLADGLREGARVVMMSSISGRAGNAGQTNYAATKAGLLGLVAGLTPALAVRGGAINAVAPGFIETRMTAAIPLAIREVARRFNALGQGGQPRDVAELVAFLARPGAGGLRGEVIRVCGLNMVGR